MSSGLTLHSRGTPIGAPQFYVRPFSHHYFKGEIMFNPRVFIAIILSCFVLSGCISSRSFVDPSIPKVSYEDIKKRSDPLKLKLLVEFQRNGEHLPKVDSTLKDNTERVLRGTGVIVPVDDQSVGEIKVVVNNIADLGSARAKGFGTGLTFGLAGSTVADAYEMTISITINGKTISRTAIKHSLYTIIGNGTLPNGVESIPPNVAFERVLEQMILRALHEMQNTGELTQIHLPIPMPWYFITQG